MSDGTVSTLSSFLYDMKGPLVDWASAGSPFYDALRRDLEAQLARDQANLDAMTPRARKVELTRRRIARCEQRFREALDFTRYDDRDDW